MKWLTERRKEVPIVKRIRGKRQPLSSAGLHALREEYTRATEPARALADETLTLEREHKAEG